MKEIAKKLAQMMHQSDPDACFAVEFWDGDSLCFGESPSVTLRLKTEACVRRIIQKGFLGFGEAYMAGDVDIADDLSELLRLGFVINFDDYKLPLWLKCRLSFLALINRDTLRRAPKNIAFHYDLGNDFYALYLDPTMTYSCAYFRNSGDSLEQAQLNKYEHICRKLMLNPDESLLDIGCGWGGMLIYAARHYGIKGVGITLSENQYEYANQKINDLGLKDQIQVLYQDYRTLNAKFDKVVSIGMFEHVGKKFIPVFINKVADLLKDGGTGLLHTIGRDQPVSGDPWFLKYIFPGSYVPTLSEMTREMGKAGFAMYDIENLRLHYAKTLEKWTENFEQNVDTIKNMFDDAFVRRWRLYLTSAASGFMYGQLRLYQVLFTNGLNNDLPITRAHVYQT